MSTGRDFPQFARSTIKIRFIANKRFKVSSSSSKTVSVLTMKTLVSSEDFYFIGLWAFIWHNKIFDIAPHLMQDRNGHLEDFLKKIGVSRLFSSE